MSQPPWNHVAARLRRVLPWPSDGSRARAVTHALSCGLLLRGLGVVHAIAFVSLWTQIDGLYGSSGLLPISEYLEQVATRQEGAGFLRLPTLCWIATGDGFLHALCAGGTVVSLLLAAGVAPWISSFVLWALYLSLLNAGRVFMSFQWDILLVEVTFTALFLAPLRMGRRAPWDETEPGAVGLWLMRLLLFKLMFLSGITKLLSLDETWWGLSALDYHYFTQPLPAWTSWYAHRLPEFVQRSSCVIMYAIEIGVPFLIFCGRRARLLAFWPLVALQVLIAATGNYNFFNLLTALLCVSLVDDAWLRGLSQRFGLPSTIAGPGVAPVSATGWVRRTARRVSWGAAGLVLIASSLVFVREMVRTVPPGDYPGVAGWLLEAGSGYAERGQPLLDPLRGFHSVNGYGLFRTMTVRRPEIVIEGSRDRRAWAEYGFRWKPGDPAERPRFVAPHQPRLDWQMWFAALDPARAAFWLEALMRELLNGNPEVLALMGHDPFPGEPPTYVRLAYYEYRFAPPGSGDWWTREPLGYLTRPLSRADLP